MNPETTHATATSRFSEKSAVSGRSAPRNVPEQATPDAPPADEPDLLKLVQRLQTAVEEIRGRFETLSRERRHREFSPARLIGALLQAVVIGFVLLALSDWVYGAHEGPILVKLAFAAVFQLGALTSFVLSRDRP